MIKRTQQICGIRNRLSTTIGTLESQMIIETSEPQDELGDSSRVCCATEIVQRAGRRFHGTCNGTTTISSKQNATGVRRSRIKSNEARSGRQRGTLMSQTTLELNSTPRKADKRTFIQRQTAVKSYRNRFSSCSPVGY